MGNCPRKRDATVTPIGQASGSAASSKLPDEKTAPPEANLRVAARAGQAEAPGRPEPVPTAEVLLLAADVGGTSSRLHLFRPPELDGRSKEQGFRVPKENLVYEAKFKNNKFDTFRELLQTFLDDSGVKQPPLLACLAVAGVIVDNKTKLVNLSWTVDGEELEKAFAISQVVLINDFEAQGFGILTLDLEKDCDVLQDAPKLEHAPMALLGAGTGLGEALLTVGQNKDYEVWPSEGGHAEFAPRQDGSSKLQFELLQYLQIKYSARSRISVERIVSGKGISNVYEFLAWKYPERVTPAVHKRWLAPSIAGTSVDSDPAVIAEAANTGECELCVLAIDIFVGAYGSEAGVLALKFMPFGGLFLTGGVTSKLQKFIKGGDTCSSSRQKSCGDKRHFLDSFLDKGRMSSMLARVPIYIVKGEDLGERGAMLKSLRLFQEVRHQRRMTLGHMGTKSFCVEHHISVKSLKGAPEATTPSNAAANSQASAAGVTLLSADVGGTSSRFQLFSPLQNVLQVAGPPKDRILFEAKYKNAMFETFADVFHRFLSDAGMHRKPAVACLAVAGAVVDNCVSFVNLGWKVDGAELEERFGLSSVVLINDFEAQGYGLLTLDTENDCEVLQEAPVLEGAPMAVVGAGTGLGEAFLTMGEDLEYEVWPSEGGHAEFAPRQDGSSKLQFDMVQYLQIKFSAKARISVERVVSGTGISNIYEFLAWKFPERVQKDVHERWIGPMAGPRQFSAAVITEAACTGECSLCAQAIDIFVGAYGAEVGVTALTHMPFGGLYLTGGVTSKVRDFLMGRKGGHDRHFLDAYLDKGRVSSMLKRVPIFVVKGEDLGERGAMLKAERLFQEVAASRPALKGHMFGTPQHCKSIGPARAEKIQVRPKTPPVTPAALLASVPPRANLGSQQCLLSADIGGTSSRLHLFAPLGAEDAAKGVPQDRVLYESKFVNCRFASFSEVLRAFLQDAGLETPPLLACLAVAGAVVDNSAHFVNLGWVIEGAELEKTFGIQQVVLINDFEAQGYGVITLDPSQDCDVLQDAPKQAGKPIAVIGAGTGLGEAFLTVGGGGDYQVWPSEGGHAEFAPTMDGSSAIQFEMLQFLQVKYSAKARISIERIVSGKGISNVYEFLAWKHPEKVRKPVHMRWREEGPGVIGQAARDGECDLCREAMDIFVDAYGAEAGVMGLTHMPFGGLYLTGGVTSKCRDFILGLKSSIPGGPNRFMESFLDKGRVSEMLRRVPVFVVKGEDTGERGARLKAARLFAERIGQRPPTRGHMCDLTPGGANGAVQAWATDSCFAGASLGKEAETPDLVLADLGEQDCLLSADVGGTSSRLRLFCAPEAGDKGDEVAGRRIVHEAQFKNARFDGFAEVIKEFLQAAGQVKAPLLACLAVAGVVIENRATFVNLGWTVDGGELEKEFGIGRVVLINDFEAQGYGILTLDVRQDCDVLQDAPPLPGAPKALLGAGTGLGEAYLTVGSRQGEYDVWPSEGGHAEFAPRQDGISKVQFEMCQFLQIKFSAKARISVERIVSGRGLSNVYEFFAWRYPKKVTKAVHNRWKGNGHGPAVFDPQVISQAAASGECDLCLQAINTFVGAYGAEAGVLALKYMPYGGLYLTGGVTSKLKDFIAGSKGQPGHFLEAFLDKGRVSAMLTRVPIYIVRGEDMGERGAMLKAIRLHREPREAQ